LGQGQPLPLQRREGLALPVDPRPDHSAAEHAVTADRLALATRVRKARRISICTICPVPITIGQPIARLISPAGWCHVRCVPHVARALRA
jgi:hypothetical protein